MERAGGEIGIAKDLMFGKIDMQRKMYIRLILPNERYPAKAWPVEVEVILALTKMENIEAEMDATLNLSDLFFSEPFWARLATVSKNL